MGQIARRRFLSALVATMLASLSSAVAQTRPGDRTFRLAIVLSTSPVAEMQGPKPAHPAVRGLLANLRRLGYVEGTNLVLERRSAEGRYDRFESILAELIASKPDAIVTVTIEMTRVAMRLTKTVPIVFALAGGGDPVAAGLVPSLARPGGNVTGVTPDAGPEIIGKRLELLKEAVPKISRVAFLTLEADWDSVDGQRARIAAKALGLTLLRVSVDPKAYTKAFDAMLAERPDALLTSGHPVHYANRKALIDFAAKHRLPAIQAFATMGAEGALLTYASEGTTMSKLVGILDKIAKGANPADLPIEQPTHYRLIVNLKTAAELGLTIPRELLLRADEVIE